MTVRHHFTVDVEEYFHPSALEPWVSRDDWDALPRRVPVVIPRLLELLEEKDVRATFFVVGWLAEKEPDLVREIARAGHEVGSHSWDHRRVTLQSPEEFRSSVRRSKELLEKLAGAPVRGFRAPSFSIRPGDEWALDILIEEGYTYDSSLFPVSQHPSYGYPGGRRYPHLIERPAGTLAEIPPTTLRKFGSNVPASGGAYFRFFPYGLTKAAFKQAERAGEPGTFYIHPWELDDDTPELEMSAMVRLRTFGGLGRRWERVARLLDDFTFDPIEETLKGMQPCPTT